jgi:Tol biopolymer transport system component
VIDFTIYPRFSTTINTWSPDSTMIAFIRSWNIWLASPTGEDQRQLTTLSGVRGPLSWSPNSRYIAFDSDHSGNQDIWMVPISGGEPTQLTTYPGWDADPTWSPRGDEIAFSSSRAGKSGLDIWALEVPPTPTESTSWGKLKTLLR